MRRMIITLVLRATLFAGWSIIGISRAMTEPSWLCLVDGAIMMAYLCMSIDDAQFLIELVKGKKRVKETNDDESN